MSGTEEADRGVGGTRSRRRRRPLAALVVATGLLVGACTGTDQVEGDFQFIAPGGQTRLHYEAAERQPVPDISGEDLFDEDSRISVADYAGDVVVVNIWGSWCTPCREEAPELQRMSEATADEDVQFLGISVRDNPRSAPIDFMENLGLTYPSIYDPSGRSLLGLRGYPRNAVPSTLLIDREQRVAAVFLAQVHEEELMPAVEDLLAEGGGDAAAPGADDRGEETDGTSAGDGGEVGGR
ncbi:TlpA family protein disulfide reductase [Actinoalloteichus caeruleus]|uniref:Thiol-disulfide isomerase or thioredoxin n=1 Tax=Actinoalloteichus caeruleus DSM 43889 TaxID=1120930 RepID=A0ABT1JLE2_ACTCY|nr:TlpA disulfide reductase family protein [Actinoalloteichus caeruleus]MCP2333337.1 Thiol-disulfide isomerase or thioredoxin [Actinoalloteichus caeruleus DSM 43889]